MRREIFLAAAAAACVLTAAGDAAANCLDADPHAVIQYSDVPGSVQTQVSPLTTDNYQEFNCTGQYIVDIEGVNAATHDMRVIAGWDSALPNDSFECTKAWSYPFVYEFTLVSLFPFKYDWVKVSQTSLRGEWVPFFGGGFCWLSHVAGDPLPDLQPSIFRTKVRIVTGGIHYYGGPNDEHAWAQVEEGVLVLPLQGPS